MGRGRTALIGMMLAFTTSLAVAFGVVAVIQRVELDHRHLRADWGKVPDYLVPLGAVAAFMALVVPLQEWRRSGRDRRDSVANQARLIVVVPKLLPLGEVDPRTLPSYRVEYVIRNYSDSLVLDVRLHAIGGRSAEEEQPGPPRGGLQSLWRHQVLGPGEATDPDVFNTLEPDPVHMAGTVLFSFIDAHGRRWWRQGAGQPQQLFDSPGHEQDFRLRPRRGARIEA
jgi:hypothetical protein